MCSTLAAEFVDPAPEGSGSQPIWRGCGGFWFGVGSDGSTRLRPVDDRPTSCYITADRPPKRLVAAMHDRR
jgi:hypothetical protein